VSVADTVLGRHSGWLYAKCASRRMPANRSLRTGGSRGGEHHPYGIPPRDGRRAIAEHEC
jgi:hypothetical protein